MYVYTQDVLSMQSSVQSFQLTNFNKKNNINGKEDFIVFEDDLKTRNDDISNPHSFADQIKNILHAFDSVCVSLRALRQLIENFAILYGVHCWNDDEIKHKYKVLSKKMWTKQLQDHGVSIAGNILSILADDGNLWSQMSDLIFLALNKPSIMMFTVTPNKDALQFTYNVSKQDATYWFWHLREVIKNVGGWRQGRECNWYNLMDISVQLWFYEAFVQQFASILSKV